jgi:hypothetical protein
VVSKADIEAFIRHGCGICDLIKRKRPAFKSVTDKTIPPVGKVWVLDSLKLRTPSLRGNSVLHRFTAAKNSYSDSYLDSTGYLRIALSSNSTQIARAI